MTLTLLHGKDARTLTQNDANYLRKSNISWTMVMSNGLTSTIKDR